MLSLQRAQVQSLVRELRSCKSHSVTKNIEIPQTTEIHTVLLALPSVPSEYNLKSSSIFSPRKRKMDHDYHQVDLGEKMFLHLAIVLTFVFTA